MLLRMIFRRHALPRPTALSAKAPTGSRQRAWTLAGGLPRLAGIMPRMGGSCSPLVLS